MINQFWLTNRDKYFWAYAPIAILFSVPVVLAAFLWLWGKEL